MLAALRTHTRVAAQSPLALLSHPATPPCSARKPRASGASAPNESSGLCCGTAERALWGWIPHRLARRLRDWMPRSTVSAREGPRWKWRPLCGKNAWIDAPQTEVEPLRRSPSAPAILKTRANRRARCIGKLGGQFSHSPPDENAHGGAQGGRVAGRLGHKPPPDSSYRRFPLPVPVLRLKEDVPACA